MTTALLLLAGAVLLGTGPGLIRGRVGLQGQRATVANDEARSRDPFAAASALDVFAVCLSAGMAVHAAAAATAEFAPPPLSAVLRRASDLLALGADPDTAWQATGCGPADAGAGLARLARRSAASGTALAAAVAELAEQSRADAADNATAAAERAGVLMAGPLGLCFLPAFICLGIVPVVAGLAGEVLGRGVL